MARKNTRGPQSTSFEKPTVKTSRLLKRLWKYLIEYKFLLIVSIIISIICNLLALLGPKLSGHAVDAIQLGVGKVDFQKVFYYAGLMIIIYLIASVLSYLLAVLLVKIGSRVVYNLRNDVYEHLMELPIKFYDSNAIGDIISVLNYDIDTVQASLSNDLVQMLASAITILGSLWMMLTISPKLVLIFTVTIPVSIMLTRYRSKKVRPLYRTRSNDLGDLNGYIEEITGGLKTITVYNRQEVFIRDFQEKNLKTSESNYKADSFASSTGPSVSFINNISMALISFFGAILFMSGSISLGNVSSFVLYSRKFSGPINEFSNIISELQSSLAAAERIFRLLDQEVELKDNEDAISIENVKGHIEFKDVSFGYTEDDLILKDYNLSVKPGQVVAIVGPTGAGKTTIINLLMRFYDIDSGSITLDGIDIRDIKRRDLRNAFSMVLQDTWLFTGTIKENLIYGREDVTEEEMIIAAKTAKIHDFIISMPNGYNTILRESGSNISKGQKQLLTIARAMLLDSPMLILDEATSNVDTQTERIIQDAMLSLMEDRTSFVIAHRLSTIQNADLIAVLKDGKVLEIGKHSELIGTNGYYAELYKAQFETVEE